MVFRWMKAFDGKDTRFRQRSPISSRRSSKINWRAFTLIELLVVIAVIAILMAILLPVLGRTRKQAKAAVCHVNLRRWGTTLALYVEDNQGRFPADSASGLWMLRGSFTSKEDPNEPKVRSYIRTQGIACCPMAVKPKEVATGGFIMSVSSGLLHWEVKGKLGSTFSAWEITSPGPPFHGSYGLNGWFFRPEFQTLIHGSLGRLGVDTFSLKGKANIPALLDSTGPYVYPSENDHPPLSDLSGTFCINRHYGYVNGLFLDWSARRIGLKELWTLKWHPRFNTAGRWTKDGGVQPDDWPLWMRKFKDY